jgi:hypothetical protein
MKIFVREEYTPRTLPESAARYGVAVLVVVLAGWLTLLLPLVAEGTPFSSSSLP